MKAFYFSATDKKLRHGDGRQIRKGRTHKVKGALEMCGHGLHASVRAIDALTYAPGTYLWVVELGGEIIHGDEKVVASERTYIHGFNSDKLLREFARGQALINIEKIKPYTNAENYKLIVAYLTMGDVSKMATASAAASAARSAANEVLEEMISSVIRKGGNDERTTL